MWKWVGRECGETLVWSDELKIKCEIKSLNFYSFLFVFPKYF